MSLRVAVAVALPDRQEVIEIELPEGATAAAAVAAAGLRQKFPQWDFTAAPLGIWSRPCAPETKLRDGDRVEIYRPLKADPKAMRRARARLKPSRRSRSAP
jgi:putative ubiquitin-RnfH superfamily antitoxin RatB of RatAB toxin-antitoxin module